jgi:hypothetical protein
MLSKSPKGIDSKFIGNITKSVGVASRPGFNQAAKSIAKRKAFKWGAIGAAGYGSLKGADYIKSTHTPYDPNFNYNRHIRENVVSGRVNPSQLHPNTVRSIMMKQGSINKEAIVGTIARKALPTAIFSALSFPGSHAEYKRKAALGLYSNVAKSAIR